MSVHGPQTIASGVPAGAPSAVSAVLTQPAVTVVAAAIVAARTRRFTDSLPLHRVRGSSAHNTGPVARHPSERAAVPAGAPGKRERPREHVAGARLLDEVPQTPMDWVSLVSGPPASVTPFFRW